MFSVVREEPVRSGARRRSIFLVPIGLLMEPFTRVVFFTPVSNDPEPHPSPNAFGWVSSQIYSLIRTRRRLGYRPPRQLRRRLTSLLCHVRHLRLSELDPLVIRDLYDDYSCAPLSARRGEVFEEVWCGVGEVLRAGEVEDGAGDLLSCRLTAWGYYGGCVYASQKKFFFLLKIYGIISGCPCGTSPRGRWRQTVLVAGYG